MREEVYGARTLPHTCDSARGPLNRSKPNAHFPPAIFLGSTPHSGGTIVSPQAKCPSLATLGHISGCLLWYVSEDALGYADCSMLANVTTKLGMFPALSPNCQINLNT